MKAKQAKYVSVAIIAAFLTSQRASTDEATQAAAADQSFQRQQDAMHELTAETKRILGRLENLSDEQKNSVVALMAISRAVAAPESSPMSRADTALRDFYTSLRKFSPAYVAPGKFQSAIRGCFDATVGCLSAQKTCLQSHTERECERNNNVVEACGEEAACVTNALLKLRLGIPDILRGRDPWPPQPFPY